ncbi:MAG: DUF4350 domain-containing protein [Spirochaetota bacterium]
MQLRSRSRQEGGADMKTVFDFFRARVALLLIGVTLLLYIASGFSEKGFGYFLVLFVAALLYILCGVTLYTLFAAGERRGGAFRLMELAYWLMLFSAFCYFVQVDAVWLKVTPENRGQTAERLRQVLQIFYFTGFCFVLIALAVSVGVRLEAKEAPTAIATLGGLLVLLVAINYWAHITPASVDMTLMRRFSLSADSRELLRGIEGKVQVTAFFPFFSELYRDVELLLRDAVAANGKISYTFIDPLREKNLADEKKVDRIGTILIEAEDPQETDAAKKMRTSRFEVLDEEGLKRLERELVSNLLQVSGRKRNIYYTQGHEEKSVSGNFKDDTIGLFDENLRALRHHVKQLTPAEGFPAKMPPADLVLVVGPQRDFSQAEKKTLKKYFDEGGKILLALDPESAADFSFLLDPLKVKYSRQKLHSDYALPPGKTTLQSVNYSEHAITAPFVKRPEERKITIFPGAGYFETGTENNPDFDVNYFLMSHFTSWIDKIPNGLRDDKAEPVASFKIGLAALSKKNGARLVAITDSDFLVNRFADMQQNRELAMRLIGWLAEEDKLTGIVAGKYDDEKVKLTGTKDTVVFHLFLYIYPFILLLAGFLVVRAKRRRMSEHTRLQV